MYFREKVADAEMTKCLKKDNVSAAPEFAIKIFLFGITILFTKALKQLPIWLLYVSTVLIV